MEESSAHGSGELRTVIWTFAHTRSRLHLEAATQGPDDRPGTRHIWVGFHVFRKHLSWLPPGKSQSPREMQGFRLLLRKQSIWLG